MDNITGVTSIKSVEVHAVNSSNTVIQLFAFEVNGRLLVDHGVWNVSQNWSDNVTGKFDTRGYDPAQAFNGDLGDKGGFPLAHQQVFGLLIFL